MMERIILVGHGSPKKDANNVEVIAGLLHRMLHPNCADNCVKVAYLQFTQPDIGAAIDACVAEGSRRVIVHPFFLYGGVHVTRDIPAKIAEGKKKHPGVEFVYTQSLGIHEGLARIIVERIRSAGASAPSTRRSGRSPRCALSAETRSRLGPRRISNCRLLRVRASSAGSRSSAIPRQSVAFLSTTPPITARIPCKSAYLVPAYATDYWTSKAMIGGCSGAL